MIDDGLPPGDLKDHEIATLRAENERLRAALKDARDSVEAWAGYASDYFRDKHDLAGDLARIDAILAAQPAPSPWRPIDEAPVPKDGSYFAICRAGEPDTIECGRYDPYISHEYEPVDGGLYRKKEWVGYEWSGINNMHRATHWMPLPTPPQQEPRT